MAHDVMVFSYQAVDQYGSPRAGMWLSFLDTAACAKPLAASNLPPCLSLICSVAGKDEPQSQTRVQVGPSSFLSGNCTTLEP